jgi:hypothetical protein
VHPWPSYTSPMLKGEAHWLAQELAALPDDAFPLLDIGSSTAAFREDEQSFISDLVFRPLSDRGCEVIHADLKPAPGVDVVMDFTDASDRRRISARQIRTVLCSNVLEHLLVEPRQAARYLVELCASRGYVIVTVPKRYGYHEDPIDNGFRPSAEQLADLFPDCEVLTATNVVGPVLAVHHARARGWPRYLMRAAVPLYRPRAWAGSVAWFWRHAEVACVVVRTP